VPHLAVLPPPRPRARRSGSPLRDPRVLGELALGLLLGVFAGWCAGLLRTRRP
jgi:hypothetical protein